ncbi:hypothetical protein EVAR_60481_1 [Eumeta japonica]|uniref:PH domain-containing protein n=1 Tax=Eumeta variegata TaxID=151549 RepID=A0A4C2A633_EUMVA|nr:hypothetical protein EVAR_60481_1 [Eumeta japonica]
MSRHSDEGPVYYREIQKNAFLKRVPVENVSGKIRALSHKKPQLKALWTLFCIHNGRTPYLEQYPEPDSPCTLSHKPIWRFNLKTAKHVTASVKAWPGDEFDFLVVTDEGPVRMLAPDWDSMQDWVSTLRDKLHELRVLSKSENVYGAPPVQPIPRAGTRDPTSPLPPTPAVPPVRVPGIELNTSLHPVVTNDVEENEPTQSETREPIREVSTPAPERTITDWDTAIQLADVPTASQELDGSSTNEKPTSLAKICGQNICLDDSILRRNSDILDSDEDFFAEIDKFNENEHNVDDSESNRKIDVFKQTVVINSDDKLMKATTSSGEDNSGSISNGTNITVIEVSNRGPPHTAIPVLGPTKDVFSFEFDRKLCLQGVTNKNEQNFVNILNTEVNVHNSNDTDYGTVFENRDTDGYGHLSLTTTVNLTVNDSGKCPDDSVYERLCMASTSKESPLLSRKFKDNETFDDKPVRKSSLPNLDLNNQTTDFQYEYLFPTSTVNNGNSITNLNFNINSHNNNISDFNKSIVTTNAKVDNRNTITTAIVTNRTISTTPVTSIDRPTTTSVTNINGTNTSSVIMNTNRTTTTAVVAITTATTTPNTGRSITTTSVTTVNRDTTSSVHVTRPNVTAITANRPLAESNLNHTSHTVNVLNSVSISNPSRILRGLHCNIARSNSQNNYDTSVRHLRGQLSQGKRNESPKREMKNDKQTDGSQKPIWKRGLTEFSLLTRLRGFGQGKGRQDSPTRCDVVERAVTSPSKVVHSSRPEMRHDGGRRRSSSLSNGQPEPSTSAPLISLRRRQAAALVAEQSRGAALVARVPCIRLPIFADAQSQVWDVEVEPFMLAKRSLSMTFVVPVLFYLEVDILFHRVPHAKMYIVNKDHENQGIGGCKHALALVMWTHRRSEDPTPTEVACYWKNLDYQALAQL